MDQWQAMIDGILHSRVGSYIYGGFLPNLQIGINAVNANTVPPTRGGLSKWPRP